MGQRVEEGTKPEMLWQIHLQAISSGWSRTAQSLRSGQKEDSIVTFYLDGLVVCRRKGSGLKISGEYTHTLTRTTASINPPEVVTLDRDLHGG